MKEVEITAEEDAHIEDAIAEIKTIIEGASKKYHQAKIPQLSLINNENSQTSADS
jgi:CRISPR/Cas system-associated exonuclease Cas4 (RecB family)